MVNRFSLAPLLLLGGMASAQSFNIDIEHEAHSAPTLPDSYGGEPFQQGRWQVVTFPTVGSLPTTPLTDINGVSTAVTIEGNRSGKRNTPACQAGWLPDDVNLYDGLRFLTATPLVIRLQNLQDGWYTVYVYGVDELAVGRGAATLIRPTTPGGGSPGILVNQATCSVAHTPGFTYARTAIQVLGGELHLRLSRPATGSSFSLSAIQLDFRVGSSFCATSTNSTGSPSFLRATSTQIPDGVASVSANNLTLAADNIPPGQSGFFIYSRKRTPGTSAPGALGAGYRCLLGAVGRLPWASTQGSPGLMISQVDLNAPPRAALTILAGSTWHFQGIYTDSVPSGFNATNAVTIPFEF